MLWTCGDEGRAPQRYQLAGLNGSLRFHVSSIVMCLLFKVVAICVVFESTFFLAWILHVY